MAEATKQVMPYPIWVYLIGLGVYGYLFTQILTFTAQNSNNILLSGLYFIEFGVHEVSHLAVFFMPQLFVAAAGSIGEIAFTVLIIVATLKGRAYFAAIFGSLWCMLAFHSVGRYIADARTQALPLVGPGERVQHDWHFILGQLGWLEYDTALGLAVTTLGTLIGAAGLIFGLYLIIRKILLLKTPKTV